MIHKDGLPRQQLAPNFGKRILSPFVESAWLCNDDDERHETTGTTRQRDSTKEINGSNRQEDTLRVEGGRLTFIMNECNNLMCPSQ